MGLGSDRLWEGEEGRDKDNAWGSDLVTEMATQEEKQFLGSR